MVEMTHIEGVDKGSIKLYALSTCVWCRKTKRLLDSLKVAYDYVFVDHLDSEDKDKAMDEIEKWNPRCSYPTLVFNDKKCIVGFKEKEIKEQLK